MCIVNYNTKHKYIGIQVSFDDYKVCNELPQPLFVSLSAQFCQRKMQTSKNAETVFC